MAMLNRFTGIGRIGNEPDFKMTNEGTAYLRFSLAIDLKKPSKKNEQKKDTKPETLWLQVVCFGELAKLMADWLFKGCQVYVEGSLQPNKYTDKDSIVHETVDLVARDIQVLEKKPQAETKS